MVRYIPSRVVRYIPCTDFQDSLNFSEGTAERLSADQHDYIFCAYDIRLDNEQRTGMTISQGWDVFFRMIYVCRQYEIGEARKIIRTLQKNPDLLTVFQVHES